MQAALTSWADAAEAVLHEVRRIFLGGVPNPEVRLELLTALEAARLRCEDASLGGLSRESAPMADEGDSAPARQ